MIITILYAVLFLVVGSPGGEQLLEPNLQTVESDSVQTEIIVRTEDLFWQSDWTFFSLDRMSFKVNSGEYGYYGPQPQYLLDGISVDPTFFGMNIPHLLPIPANQISELETLEGSGAEGGVPYNAGMLNLKSTPIKKGFGIYASTQLGHNSNEPGPWIFDRGKVTPNIDRFGHWADAGFSLKMGPWYSKGHIQTISFLNANPFVQTRIRNIIALPEQGEYPDGRSTTQLGLLETGIKSERLNIRLQGIRSESNEFLFFQPLGREIPTSLNMDQLTAAGEVLMNSSIGFRLMVQHKEKGTGYRRNRFDEEFDWNQITQSGRASFYLHSERIEFDLGSEYRSVETEASGLHENQQYIDLFLDQSIMITPWMKFGSYTALTFHEEEIPVQLKGNLDIEITKNWATGFEGSYSELLPEIANPINEWVSNGYDLLDRLDINNFVPNDIPNTELMTISHWQEFRVSDRFKTRLRADYLDHLKFNIPFQDAYYYLNLSTLPGGYFLFSANTGQRLKLSMKTEVDWSKRFRQTLGLYSFKTLDGDPAYKSYWKTIPETLIRHSSIFTPYPDLEIRLNVEYQTETVWDEFRRLDGELNRTFNVQFPFQFFQYSNEIAPGLNMDLIFSKWFWEQRLRAVFMLNNMFNQDYQRHPIGAIDGFGYMARFELRL
jgi:hypothetical protein